MKTICIVEDNSDLRDLIERILSKRFYVSSFGDGQEAISYLERMPVQLLIVDLGLPGMSGNQVIERVQRINPYIPIVVISSQSILDSNYTPYKLGATHFLKKPFDIRELFALVVSVVQFVGRLHGQKTYVGGVCLDHEKLEAYWENRALKLSPTEFKLFHYLAINYGEVVTREAILENCWGESDAVMSDRVVDYQIARLRKKINFSGIEIISKYSKGYSLLCEEAA